MENNRNRGNGKNNGESPEPKKESRLTSIIDQLLINKCRNISRAESQNGEVTRSNNNSSIGSSGSGYGVPDHLGVRRIIGILGGSGFGGGILQRVVPTNIPNLGFGDTDEQLYNEEEIEEDGDGETEQKDVNPDSLEDTKNREASDWIAGGILPGERQLCHHRVHHHHHHHHPELFGLPTAGVGLVSRLRSCWSPEGGASFEYQGQQPTCTAATLHQLATSSERAMPTDALATSSTLETNSTASAAGPNKSEGGARSPEPESSSPSVSPHSPSPARGFPTLLVPGFGLAGLSLARPAGLAAPYSPPPTLERFSPANLAGGAPAIKQMEMMTRNYSDFMRSLAAKYNQNSTQESFPMNQSNGGLRCFDGNFAYKGSSPFLVRNMDLEGTGSCLGSGLIRPKLESQNSPTPTDGRSTNSNNSPSLVTGSLNSDFSSSQTLLNLVRTASAQSASQLENYLKGAVKRSADGENRLDPLDLSVAHNKRPKMENLTRDIRDALQEAELAGSDCTSSLRSTPSSSGKPGWMTLLDKRMHPSSRTSKNFNSGDKQRCLSICTEKSCSTQSDASDVSQWTVEDVVKFVMSVDTCQEYAEKFREQSIDGYTLPLLTEEHLTLYLGLKLGPALKLRTTLARRIGHCAVCMHCIHCHGEESTEIRRRDSSRSPSVSK